MPIISNMSNRKVALRPRAIRFTLMDASLTSPHKATTHAAVQAKQKQFRFHTFFLISFVDMKIKNKKITKNFFEQKAWHESFFVCGIDEVGRGCLAGPLVTAAVILPMHTKQSFLKDSKVMTVKKRETAYSWIVKHCLCAYAITNHKYIDTVNIHQATLTLMKRSFFHLLTKTPNHTLKYILIDSMPIVIGDVSNQKHLSVVSFDKGESLSSSIAAASIFAKVTRDRIMKKICNIIPNYQFKENKGYASATHVKTLTNVGPSILHRKTFIKKILQERKHGEKQKQLF